MSPQVIVRPMNGSATASTNNVSLGSTGSFLPVVSRHLPPAVEAGQAYFWSYEWQLGEEESLRDLAEGNMRTFQNPEDAIRWLLSSEG